MNEYKQLYRTYDRLTIKCDDGTIQHIDMMDDELMGLFRALNEYLGCELG